MNDFKPDDDLKKLDIQDLRFSRPRKPQGSSKINIPPQYLIIGTSILVVLMLIMGISSMMTESTKKEPPSKNPDTIISNEINPSDHSSSSTGGNNRQTGAIHDNEAQNDGQLQDIRVPQIAPFPTESVSQPENHGETKRVELPGNIGSVLSSQQNQIDSASQGLMYESVAPQELEKSTGHKLENSTEHKQQETGIKTGSKLVPRENERVLKKLPSNHFTLQLSSASRSDTLEAFARQQKLKTYQVYETQRNHKPWFVLISGNYASSSAAKKAIATLPAEVQAQKPWVKSMRQVHQQLKK